MTTPSTNTNGPAGSPGSNGTVAGAVSRLGNALISTLPPAFILLILLNVAFISIVMWFLDDQLAQRTHMAETLFNRCMDVLIK